MLLQISFKIIVNSKVIVKSNILPDDNFWRNSALVSINGLRVTLETVVCIFHTFDNNFKNKNYFT